MAQEQDYNKVIEYFGKLDYEVSFPLFEKVDVNNFS